MFFWIKIVFSHTMRVFKVRSFSYGILAGVGSGGGRCSLEMRHGLLLGSWVFSSRELLYLFHCAPIFGRGLHQISTTLGGPSWKLSFMRERSDQLWDVTAHNGKPRVCFLNATHFCCRILEGSIIWIFRSSLLSYRIGTKTHQNGPKSSKSSPSLGDLGCFLFEVHLCFAWKSVFCQTTSARVPY